jgi:voltage-gated potassium channel
VIQKIKSLYEFLMFFFVVLSVGTIWYESTYNGIIIWGTWFVFLIDFIVRFYSADNKLDFIKKNPFEIIALIPLDALFRTARLARLVQLMRLKIIAKHYSNPLIKKMEKNKIQNITTLSFIVIFISTIPFYFYEPIVTSFGEAFIWSFTSLLFFGNTSASPETLIGKIIIILLTMLGVCLHAILMSGLFKLLKNKVFKNLKKRNNKIHENH